MERTEKFKRQHAELAAQAKEIGARLAPDLLREDAQGVRTRMARFLGQLRVHAAMEDGALYPDLLAHPDPKVQKVARDLLDRVGGLYARFDAFARRWLAPGAIEADPDAFARETLEAFALLRRRMTEEHAELYPLAERCAS